LVRSWEGAYYPHYHPLLFHGSTPVSLELAHNNAEEELAELYPLQYQKQQYMVDQYLFRNQIKNLLKFLSVYWKHKKSVIKY
jgi:hypothetical protein